MTLFMGVPVRRAREIPGGNQLVGLLYGAGERAARRRAPVARGREGSPVRGMDKGAEPGNKRVHRVRNGPWG